VICDALAEAEAERTRAVGTRPILGIHVIVGPSFREKMRNAQNAMVEGGTRLINADSETSACRRPTRVVSFSRPPNRHQPIL
jgi:hypothetical protein